MENSNFPDGFLWGVATAAHQGEGDNRNSDWWAWEHRPGTPVAEPSGSAIEHYTRFASDVALLAELGCTTYRFSVEWARVEPAEDRFDEHAIRHYRDVTQAVRDAGMTPMVTLNHFTLPAWLALRGGWMSPDAPSLFARYCTRVVAALGDLVDWYCTINEPGAVAFGGYLGALGFPPGTTDLASWNTAIAGLKQGHTRGLAAVKEARPEANAGATHSMTEYQAVINVPPALTPVMRALVNVGPLRRRVLPPLLRRRSRRGDRTSDRVAVDRTTQERHVKPSGRLLGEIARTSALIDRRS
jgi:beta-glucosidase